MSNEKRNVKDPKYQAGIMIRHYVIAGYPGDSAIENPNTGAKDLVGYYQGILESIQGYSNLSLEEIEAVIKDAPDMIENTTDKLNDKSKYLEALSRMRKQ